MTRLIFAFPLLALVLLSPHANAETLRCGNKIVDVGMSMADVKKYCGKPTTTSTELVDVRSGGRLLGQTEVHIWHYRRSSQQRTAVLKFDQEKLTSISYVRK